MVPKVALRFLDPVSGRCNGVGESIFMAWAGM